MTNTLISTSFKYIHLHHNVTGPGATDDNRDDILSNKALGAKMDDGSIALGASLISNDMLGESASAAGKSMSMSMSMSMSKFREMREL